MIIKRNDEVATTREVRAAILRELRAHGALWTAAERAAIADAFLADAARVAFANGMYLGAVARDVARHAPVP